MKLQHCSRLFALALMLGAAVTASADPLPPANWQEYKSVDGRFRVEMPAKPQEIAQDLANAPGQKMYALTLNYGKGGMIATASDIAADRVAAGPDKNIDFVRDTAVKALNATVSNEQKETVGKYPARRFDYSAANGYSGTMRLVLADRRIYQLNAIGPAGYSSTPELKRFLDSFAVTGN